MLVGEQYAVETFASTGHGKVIERGHNTHFMAIPAMLDYHHPVKKVRDVLNVIKRNHHTLAFCQRFLMPHLPDGMTHSTLNSVLNVLSSGDKQVLKTYPPLCDVPGSMTSQMEHTLFIRDTGLEVITRGPDY